MRGAYFQYIKAKGMGQYSSAVEEVMARQKEAATLRLARIHNGTHPDYKNGHPKAEEKGFK
jgi:hypothetical protein